MQSMIDAVKGLPIISSIVEREHAKMTVRLRCMSAQFQIAHTSLLPQRSAEHGT